MAEVTTMVIKVDLKCCKCYKKVKKILCKIPQIKDQVYDEKQNTVTIKVACCYSPEKILQKIRCKGGKSILSIEIKPPPKKQEEPKKPQEKPKEPTKPHPCGGPCEQLFVGDLHVLEGQFVIVGLVIVVATGVIIAGIVVVIKIIVKNLARLCNHIMLHRCIWSSINLLV
ncbi:protein PYRICULARIA ORYZAE RESISTANCE 21-like [Pistacia vera]|uniref:protein PYRICULARIA ORYZAE RESISTANCE 21-like n=1 Tax=Pistacia vera TaxID=55513 RepID=UPI001263B611|nr:protein PYRICULARIA ORYZAE RESISTANCE 21-like [Pistacia vera]